MSIKRKFLKKIKKGKFENIAIIGHSSVDPDSIASAYGMEFIMKELHPSSNVDILVDGISKHTSKVMEYFDRQYKVNSDSKYDLIIIVDVNVPSQLGKFSELVQSHDKNDIILIDHHTPTDFTDLDVSLVFIDDNRTSTAEIIWELILELSLKPPETLLNILLSGIIYDSRRFYSLNKQTLGLLDKMFQQGVNYDIAVSLIQKRLEESERIARLKCASRIQYEKLQDWIIVWSRVGSHEGSSARSILDLGADVALIYSTRSNETRLSVRATHGFQQQTDIHFGRDVMKELGMEFNGDGGGHSTAAALNIPINVTEEKLKKRTLALIQKLLKKSKSDT
ncbi:MAG: DHH family phosphoesterase [Candidatus Heimdallarchaeota archaeon]|nr:DHH family phosphoesterase [Candidatus Heimdallarchaeota archaeon]MBY8993671.1 DHH family phosphoesterase [Candidatus Heimdallarchaeota archaeon]